MHSELDRIRENCEKLKSQCSFTAADKIDKLCPVLSSEICQVVNTVLIWHLREGSDKMSDLTKCSSSSQFCR